MLDKLFAPWEACQWLISLGIIPKGIFWYDIAQEEGKTRVRIITGPPGEPMEYKERERIPAWSKAEIDAMIGGEFPKPDLWREADLKRLVGYDANTYPLILPEKLLCFSNGAQASAEALAFLISKGLVKASEANLRYRQIFGNG